MRFLLLLLITLLSVLPQETFAQQTEKEETIATLNAKKEEVVRADPAGRHAQEPGPL